MKSMRTLLNILLTATTFSLTFSTSAHPAPTQPQQKPIIQLAILLDTSNSMDGLIDQARTQLWRVVNEFGKARKGGVMPELQVALYEYGNTRLRSDEGYIRRVLPFTTDLDRVSEELFTLQTSGGDEYCGQVIGEAVRRLDWSASANDLRVIFIAGNEPFTQGPVDFKTSGASATARGSSSTRSSAETSRRVSGRIGAPARCRPRGGSSPSTRTRRPRTWPRRRTTRSPPSA